MTKTFKTMPGKSIPSHTAARISFHNGLIGIASDTYPNTAITTKIV
jgi:hypothetical protein